MKEGIIQMARIKQLFQFNILAGVHRFAMEMTVECFFPLVRFLSSSSLLHLILWPGALPTWAYSQCDVVLLCVVG